MASLELFLIFLKAAVLSVGGMSALPVLRQDLVVSGLVTETEILEALTIGMLSTGPTGLFFVSLGYFAAGLPGAILALAAASLPPLGIVAAIGLVRKQLLSGWAAGVLRGVALSTSGLLAATGVLLVAPAQPLPSVPFWQLALAVGAAALVIHGKVHPGLLIAVGALSGLVFGLGSN